MQQTPWQPSCPCTFKWSHRISCLVLGVFGLVFTEALPVGRYAIFARDSNVGLGIPARKSISRSGRSNRSTALSGPTDEGRAT